MFEVADLKGCVHHAWKNTSEVNPEVMDTFGEISNMVFGNVKTDLEEHLGPLHLGIPTVIVGEKFNIRNVSNPAWAVLKFVAFGTEQVDFRMCVSSPGSCSPAARRTS